MTRFMPGPNFNELAQAAAHARLIEVAEEGVRIAGNSVPDDSGHYRRSLEVFDDSRGVGWQTDDVGAVAIEYGATQAPAQAPMRQAGTKLGKYEPR